jgi:hypothetical protein
MSWWLPDPELDDNESVLWRTTANHTQEFRRQVGGTLVVTERRLLFTPGRFDASIGGQSWWAPRGAIISVEEEPRTTGLHFGAAAAGNRSRLRLSTAYGSDELFTVNHLKRKIAELGSLLGLPTFSRP